MKKYYFTKINGAGNDFILFDKSVNSGLKLSPESIQRLCNRRKGIGADGIITIGDTDIADFEMEYYNADGSLGSLCGNGSRCALKFAYTTGRHDKGKMIFFVGKEKYSGEMIGENMVKFNLNQPKKLKTNFKIKAAEQLINASFADTGSPHVVINCKDVLMHPDNPQKYYNSLEHFPVIKLGKEIRYHKDFETAGTNVNFIDVNNGKVLIRTYERGVEDETLACGTGSTAAAIISYLNNNLQPPITVVTYGGDELIINFNVENQQINNLSLSGPADISYTGEFYSHLYF